MYSSDEDEEMLTYLFQKPSNRFYVIIGFCHLAHTITT